IRSRAIDLLWGSARVSRAGFGVAPKRSFTLRSYRPSAPRVGWIPCLLLDRSSLQSTPLFVLGRDPEVWRTCGRCALISSLVNLIASHHIVELLRSKICDGRRPPLQRKL